MRQQARGDDGRFAELVALSRLAAASAARADEHGVVEEILEVVWELVPSRHPLLFLVDPDQEQFRLFMRGQEPRRMPMSERSIVRRIHENGKGEVINDLVSDPDASWVLFDEIKAKQVIAAPVCLGAECVGVLGAVDSLRGAFCDDELTALNALADQAAVALDNARLRLILERQMREIEGLHQLSQLLTSSSTPDHLVAESVRIVADLVDCEKVALLQYDEDADELAAVPQAVGLTDNESAQVRVPLSQPSLSASVFRTQAPLISNDAGNDEWVSRELRDLLSIETLLVVPLATGGRPTGVLKLINARKGHFDDGDVRFCSILGGRLGGIIESSHAREREHALVQRLREADQTKSEFVSMLGHELKGPITTVIGFGEILQQQWHELEDPKRDRMLGIVTEEVGRLGRLVNDLLDLSRIEGGTLRYEIAPMSLHELIESIVSVHSSLTAEHDLDLTLPNDLPKVQGDADRIRQVLLNLLSNATRYSPEGTTVTLVARAAEEGRCVEVAVKDHGIGIATEDQQRLFSKFVSLPKPAGIQKGTGLGLYITKGIVEAHGGRLWVESSVDEGSTFFFTLPVAQDQASQ